MGATVPRDSLLNFNEVIPGGRYSSSSGSTESFIMISAAWINKRNNHKVIASNAFQNHMYNEKNKILHLQHTATVCSIAYSTISPEGQTKVMHLITIESILAKLSTLIKTII